MDGELSLLDDLRRALDATRVKQDPPRDEEPARAPVDTHAPAADFEPPVDVAAEPERDRSEAAPPPVDDAPRAAKRPPVIVRPEAAKAHAPIVAPEPANVEAAPQIAQEVNGGWAETRRFDTPSVPPQHTPATARHGEMPPTSAPHPTPATARHGEMPPTPASPAAPLSTPHAAAPVPPVAPVPHPAPRTVEAAAEPPKPAPSLAPDFATDKEHPVCPIPFTLVIGDQQLEGTGLSLTHAYVKVPEADYGGALGGKHLVRLQFRFEGFHLELTPDVQIAAGREADELAMIFVDPTGAHLPQLRYVINSFIAGDFVTLGAFLSYTGPVQPKSPKAKAGEAKRNHLKSLGVILVSLLLIAVALNIVTHRYIYSYEARPVFIAQAGQEMRSTSPGQITYLNAEAGQGDILYSISANSGDVLNFQLPCDCSVQLADGIYEGATVLPSDPILTFHRRGETRVQVESMLSVEGLTRAVNGDNVAIVISDGRVVPVRVVQSSATNAAAQNGDIYLPVSLQAPSGLLTADDVGKPARVRLTRTLPFLRFLKKDIPA